MLKYHFNFIPNSDEFVIELVECKRPDEKQTRSKSAPSEPLSLVDKFNDDWSAKCSRYRNNVSRAKSEIKRIAFNNPWDYFATLTFSPELFDRFDKSSISKYVRTFFNHFRSRRAPEFCYLLVFEPHKNGAVHCHALIKGLPSDLLVDSGHKSNGAPVFNCDYFSKHFGHNSFVPLYGSIIHTSYYITKYLNKSLDTLDKFYGSSEHLFMCSKGLNRGYSVPISFVSDSFVPAFSNDYCSKLDVHSIDELRELLSSGSIRSDFLSEFARLSPSGRVPFLQSFNLFKEV